MCSTRVDPPIHVVLAPTVLEGVTHRRPAHPNGRSCADCGTALHRYHHEGDWRSRHAGRGLCAECYMRHEATGTLLDFPRTSWRCEDLTLEGELIRTEHRDWTWPQVAAHMGISHDRLEQARTRHNRRRRAAGEPVPLFRPLLSGAAAQSAAEHSARGCRGTF